MNAIILSIGDELALGQTVDTNSAWLSQQLSSIGLRVVAHATVADDQAAIEDAIRTAAARAEVLLISGGLGPTEDDLTRQALAGALGVPLELNDRALQALTAFFQRLNRPMVESNKVQALIPRGALMIENTAGTAPGIDATWQSGDLKQSSRIFVMPGVPKEMKTMFTRDVLPHLEQLGGGAVIVSRTLHTFGLGESNVAEMLGDLMQRGRNPSVGTTVSGGIVSLRINAHFESKERATKELETTVAACHEKLGDLIYGQDEQTLPEVVARLLFDRPGITVTTAESCTGGLLAKMLTDISGSSAYFQRGWVTYSNQAKMDLLGVAEGVLQQYGAVSDPVAAAMAAGVVERSGAGVGLAISGIAGPDGGTPEKPVGTVAIALASVTPASPAEPRAIRSAPRTFLFSGDREFIRDRSAKMALTILRFHLLGKPLPFPVAGEKRSFPTKR